MRHTLVLLVLLTLTLPATARHGCASWSTTTPDFDLGTGVPGVAHLYVDRNANVFGEGILGEDWWVYEETNGIAGLQRADEVIDDTCHGMIVGDTVAF